MEENNVDTIEETIDQLDDDSPRVPVTRQLGILAAILLLIFGAGYVPELLRSFEAGSAEAVATVPDTLILETLSDKLAQVDPFEGLTVQAQAAYVWDVQKQRALYQKNPDKQLPLASVTKLMTALVAYELINNDTEIPITISAIWQDGDSGLLDGESFVLKNLLDLTLLSSSNDGAFAIATTVGALLENGGGANTFVEAMNIRAGELGLTQTYYRNPTGLDISKTEGGAYGSSRDTTFLMEFILTHYPEILEETQEEKASIKNELGNSHAVENTNHTVDRIEGLIGSKTGYTELAGGNLVIAFDVAFNRPVIVVVLGSTRNGRFDDVLTLADAARKSIK